MAIKEKGTKDDILRKHHEEKFKNAHEFLLSDLTRQYLDKQMEKEDELAATAVPAAQPAKGEVAKAKK